MMVSMLSRLPQSGHSGSIAGFQLISLSSCRRMGLAFDGRLVGEIEQQKLRLLVHSGIESPTYWAKIETDFGQFASRLLAHEHAENRVLQEAFTSDIGTGD